MMPPAENGCAVVSLAQGGYSTGVIILSITARRSAGVTSLCPAQCCDQAGQPAGGQCQSLVPVFLGEHSTVLPVEQKQPVWKQELYEPGASLLGGGGVRVPLGSEAGN